MMSQKQAIYFLIVGFMILCSPSIYGEIQFQHGSIFGVGLRASTIDAGDLDGDGDLDLAVANIYSDSVSIAYNDGNGNFNNVVDVPLDTGRQHPIALTIGDLDGYGNLDMALAFVQNLEQAGISQPAQSGVIFFYAEDDGSYTQIYQPVAGIPSMVDISDLDGDGDDELLVGNNGELDVDDVTGAIVVVDAGFYPFENMGRGMFSFNTPLLTDGSLVDFTVFDYDGDGYKDVIGVSQGTTSFDSNFNMIYIDMNLSLFQGTDAGLSEYNPTYVEFIPWAIDQGDFNSDGNVDLVISNTGDIEGLASFTGQNASVNIFENLGNRFSPLASIPMPGITFAVLPDDYDLDGDVDLIVTIEEIVDVGGASRLDASMRILENDGTGGFTETSSLPLAEEPRYAVQGDFDGDGDTDVAVLCSLVDTAGAANALNGEVYVMFNNAVTGVGEWMMF